MEQKLEWLEAQKIEISVDLFVAAKEQLEFLGVVDQNQWLYDGLTLERAIYRYNAYWLPMLAKYTESSSICKGPLVPPLDCEWVWHCHRLNPVRYKSDCEELFGRVLDNSGVVSSVNGNCKLQSEHLWKRLYPMESYDIDLDKTIPEPKDTSALEKCTTYDLVSAVKRQSSFYNEVSRAHVDNDIILQEAVARYKAFLYLIKRNHEKSIEIINVPTYDIDLIWHTHQLNPFSYTKDLEKIFGNILQHDDTDSDQSQGNKLHTGFSGTTAQWEERFGQKYSKDGVDTTPVLMVAAEKHSAGARCFAFDDKCVAGARCFAFAKATEKRSAGARCFAFSKAAKKRGAGARCFAFAKAAEKRGAGARCFAFAKAAEKRDAGARCFAIEVGKKADRCFAMAAEKNGGGCGNMMKDNANENASSPEAQNGVDAA